MKRNPAAASRAAPKKKSKRGAKRVDAGTAAHIEAGLREMVPHPKCELDFTTPFQLLVATILAAQSTDKGVNKVTPELFRRYPTPRALANAPQETVEKLVHATGFFRQKAKNIRETARRIAEEHAGEVPRSMDVLVTLPGVARKTANVVLGTAYDIAAGIAVDTHAKRVSQRLGLSLFDDPVRIEKDLMALFPQSHWPTLQHRLVLFGRYTCTARAPRCAECKLLPWCRAPESAPLRAGLKPAR